ncbi:MAG: CARDB domain-containing protein, partial [Candidatus Thermoplasmatota archaeon]
MLSDINKIASLTVALFFLISGMFVTVSSLDGSHWTADSSSPSSDDLARAVERSDLTGGMKKETANYLKNPSLGVWDENDEIANWTGDFASYVDYRIGGLLGENASVKSQPYYEYAKQAVDVEANQTYYMEAWFRVPEGINGTADVRLDYQDVGGTTHQSEELHIVEADGWQSIELTVTEENTGSGQIELYTYRGDNESYPDVAIGAAWFSDQESPGDWPVVPDNVTLTINTEGQGTTYPSEGNHTYPYMDEVTVEAVPANNWEFVNWTGDNQSEDRFITLTMDDDKEITAHFEEVIPAELVLQNWSVEPKVVDPGENVTIEGEVENIGDETGSDSVDLYVNDMENYADYENVELGPGESTNVTFEYNDTENVGTYQVRVEFYQHFDDYWESEFDVTVTEFVLTIEIEGEGSTEPVEGDHTYLEGEELNITAMPADGWYFIGWTGDYEGSEEEINITMDKNKSITAHFAEEGVSGNYLENPSLGEWTADDEIDNWTGNFASYVDYRIDGLLGENASVRSQPYYEYAHQAVDVEANQTYYMEAWFRVPEGINGTASVRLDYEDAGGTTHESKELQIVEADGWQSIELTVTEEDTGTGEVSLYTHRGENESYPDVAIGAAWFSHHPSPADWPVPDSVDLTINIEGEGNTTPAEGNHTYSYGERVTIEAVSAEGWYFVEWTGDHNGTEAEMNIRMDADKQITAWFDEIKDYDLTLTIEVVGEGSTEPSEGNHTYQHGEQVSVEATPADGWQFIEWAGDETGTDPTINVTMDANKSITAVFEEEMVVEYTLTIDIDGE